MAPLLGIISSTVRFLFNGHLNRYMLTLAPGPVFPDRVGRVIIDGVVNTHYWADLPSYSAWPCTFPSHRL